MIVEFKEDLTKGTAVLTAQPPLAQNIWSDYKGNRPYNISYKITGHEFCSTTKEQGTIRFHLERING